MGEKKDEEEKTRLKYNGKQTLAELLFWLRKRNYIFTLYFSQHSNKEAAESIYRDRKKITVGLVGLVLL